MRRACWLQAAAETSLADGTRAVVRHDGGAVYPQRDASVIHYGSRAVAKARAKRQRQLWGPRQDFGDRGFRPALPAWW